MATRDLVLDDGLHYHSCWEEAEIEHVLATLSRLEQGISGSTLQQRRDQRKMYVAPVLVAIHRKGKRTSRALLTVVARDLSRSGIGLLAPLFFEPPGGDPTETMLRADQVFREGSVLDLGLKKPDDQLLWVYGTVQRICTVQHDYLDVGIRFNGRRNLALDFDFI
jgi:hypothetical protein